MAGTALTTLLLTLMLFLTVILVPSATIQYAAAGSESITDGSTIDTDRTVASGDTLQMSGEIDIAHGVTITVESGGTIVLDQANLTTTGTGSVYLGLGEQANLTIVNPVASGTKVVDVEIQLASFETWGPTLSWSDGVEQNMTNVSSLTLSKSMSDSDPDAVIQFTGRNIPASRIILISVSVEGTEVSADPPWYLPSEGFSAYDSRKWSLINDGTLTMIDSSILGAAISGSGVFSALDSHFNLSAPVSLTSSATFSITGGGMDGSDADEYIDAEYGAEVQWNSSSSTGSTDRWIKTLACQVIQTPGVGTQISITNLSWKGTVTLNREGVVDSNAQFMIGSCGSPAFLRVVEVADSAGLLWNEEAVIDNVSLSSSWGTFSVGPIPLSYDALVVVEFSLPEVSVTTIELDSTAGVAGKPIAVTVTVTNTGDVAATVPIGCSLSDGSDAEVSPFGPTILIAAGETGVVLLDWRHTLSGDETLTCAPMVPSMLENSSLFGGGAASSETVRWESLLQPEDTTSTTLLLIGGMGAVLIALFAYLQKTGRVQDAKEKAEADKEFEELDEGDEEYPDEDAES